MPVIEQDTKTTINGAAVFTYAEVLEILKDAAVAAGLVLPDMGETGDVVTIVGRKNGSDTPWDQAYNTVLKTVDVEGAGTTPVTPPEE